MSPDPSVPLVDGSISLADRSDPLLVDPTRSLLAAVIESYRGAYPDLVDPDLNALRAADTEESSQTRSPDVPTLTVLASEAVIDAVTDGFHATSRLAALTESGTVELLTLREPQPNVVLAGETTGCVLVEHRDEMDESGAADRSTRHPVGDDPSLHERYADLVAAASTKRLRTPSRHRIYGAFVDRCGTAVAADLIRVLDAAPGLSDDDIVDPRIRAYAVGARHGVLDHDLRRACEDAGLGSPSTFTRVKRRLIDAELVQTERVPQPVGRPRERIVATATLAQPSPSSVAEPIRVALEGG